MKVIQKSSAANLKVVFDYFVTPGTFAARLNINFFSAMVLDNNNGTGHQLDINCICLWMFLKKKGELRILSRWVKCLSLGESAKILFYKKQRGGENLLCLFKTDQALLTKRWYSTKRSAGQMKGNTNTFLLHRLK